MYPVLSTIIKQNPTYGFVNFMANALSLIQMYLASGGQESEFSIVFVYCVYSLFFVFSFVFPLSFFLYLYIVFPVLFFVVFLVVFEYCLFPIHTLLVSGFYRVFIRLLSGSYRFFRFYRVFSGFYRFLSGFYRFFRFYRVIFHPSDTFVTFFVHISFSTYYIVLCYKQSKGEKSEH